MPPGGPPQFVRGGSPQAPGDWNRNQIQAGVTMLQPAAIAFRLSDALQKATYTTSSNAGDITQIEAAIAELQGQVASLNTQIMTLQAQVAAQQTVINSLNYNTVEVSTGTTYLDARTIYKKSLAFSGINATNGIYAAAHNILNMSYLVAGQCVGGVASLTQYPLTYVNMSVSPPVDGMSFWCDQGFIYIAMGNVNRSSNIFVVTLWYTCTDR